MWTYRFLAVAREGLLPLATPITIDLKLVVSQARCLTVTPWLTASPLSPSQQLQQHLLRWHGKLCLSWLPSSSNSSSSSIGAITIYCKDRLELQQQQLSAANKQLQCMYSKEMLSPPVLSIVFLGILCSVPVCLHSWLYLFCPSVSIQWRVLYSVPNYKFVIHVSVWLTILFPLFLLGPCDCSFLSLRLQFLYLISLCLCHYDLCLSWWWQSII